MRYHTRVRHTLQCFTQAVAGSVTEVAATAAAGEDIGDEMTANDTT